MVINKLPFETIEWYDNGEKVQVDPKLVEEWGYLGFNNADFVKYIDSQ